MCPRAGGIGGEAQLGAMRNPTQFIRAVHDRLTLNATGGSIGIALVGIGGWGAANAANIMRSRRFTVRGVYDVQPTQSANFCKRFGTTPYDSLGQLLMVPEVQAVCLTTPNPYHVELVKACADAGKHIFVEKPLASLPEDCAELGRYCRDRGVLLQVGHQMRQEPAFREMKRLLESGTFGRPLYAQGVCALERRQREDWRSDRRACPGGSMEQLGIHLVDALVYVFGPPGSFSGWRRCEKDGGPKLDWTTVSMTFENQVRATVSASFSAPRRTSLELFLERGRILTDGQRLWTASESGQLRRSKLVMERGAVLQFKAFADSIATGRAPETGAAEAQAVMTVIQSVHGT